MPSWCGNWWLFRFGLPCCFLTSSLWLWGNCSAYCNYFGTQICWVLYALYSNTLRYIYIFFCVCVWVGPTLHSRCLLSESPPYPQAVREASLKLSADSLLNVLKGCVIQKKLALVKNLSVWRLTSQSIKLSFQTSCKICLQSKLL